MESNNLAAISTKLDGIADAIQAGSADRGSIATTLNKHLIECAAENAKTCALLEEIRKFMESAKWKDRTLYGALIAVCVAVGGALLINLFSI